MFLAALYRIGGRLGCVDASRHGAALGIPPLVAGNTNAEVRTMPGGQFHWGSGLLKGNGGVQSSPQPGRKSGVECKGIRRVYCERDTSSSCESRA